MINFAPINSLAIGMWPTFGVQHYATATMTATGAMTASGHVLAYGTQAQCQAMAHLMPWSATTHMVQGQ